MAHSVLDGLDVHARGNEHRCVSAAQIVERDAGEVCRNRCVLEHSLAEVAVIERTTTFGHEQRIAGLGAGACRVAKVPDDHLKIVFV